MYRTLNLNYDSIFARNCRDALLKVASEFKANHYWQKRKEIGEEMTKKTRQRLRDLHGDLYMLNVLRIDLPSDWEAKIVQTQAAKQQIETERMKQEALKIRADTGVIIASYEKKAAVIIADGTANSSLLVQTAYAEAQHGFLEAEAHALEYIQDKLGGDTVKYQSLTAIKQKTDALVFYGNSGLQPVFQLHDHA
eukprot:GHVO01070045.1.p1 GENE.GHVO01070045.1~~GHVO01070045.1.p1  ORF type:complete len:194 (+),score=33.29 GHVO01070045.1:817-1398(+)